MTKNSLTDFYLLIFMCILHKMCRLNNVNNAVLLHAAPHSKMLKNGNFGLIVQLKITIMSKSKILHKIKNNIKKTGNFIPFLRVLMFFS